MSHCRTVDHHLANKAQLIYLVGAVGDGGLALVRVEIGQRVLHPLVY